jgi:hypothetical protein
MNGAERGQLSSVHTRDMIYHMVYKVQNCSWQVTRRVAARMFLETRELAEGRAFLVKRRSKNVAVVATANKMARTNWALLAYERAYQSGT